MNPVNSLKRFSRSLAARLFLLYGFTFAVFVLAGLGTFYRYQFMQHVEEARESAGMLAEVAAQAVAESALIGDFDAVKRTLQKTLLRTPFRTAMFIDLSGGAIMLDSDTEREAAAPAWLRRLIADRLYDVSRNIVVGGRDYGVMRLVFDIDRTANQIWNLALEVLAVCVLCLLAGLWVTRSLLKRWLGNLDRLQAFEARVVSGEVDAQAVLLADAPAEIRDAIELVNRAAASLRGQFGQRIDYLMNALVQHKSAMDQAAIVSETDVSGRLTYVNDLFVRSSGYAREELLGRRLDEIGARQAPRDPWRPFDTVWHGEFVTHQRDGRAGWRKRTIVPILEAAGRVEKYICVDIDITREKEIEARLQAQAVFGRQALGCADLDGLIGEAASIAASSLDVEFCRILKLDPDGRSLISKAAVGFAEDRVGLRIASAEADGHYAYALRWRAPVVIEELGRETRFQPSASLAACGIASGIEVPIAGAEGKFGILAVYSRERREYTAESVDFLQSLANTLAAAIERQNAEQRFAYLAQFDTLTGLPNRNLFRDRFAQTLSLAQRKDWQVGVMFVDLDRFKAINDSLGHGAGDRLLTQVSARLQNCVRAGDTVARLGGDEFAIVLSNMARADDACLVAEKVVAALASPFDLDGQEVYVSASLGISVFPGDGTNADVLLRNADTAMYRAKEQGRNNYQFYLPEMNGRAMERLEIEMQLRHALERGEFLLHYQPKVDLASGTMCGLEALLRWQHPERGLVPPLEFIKVLEETGLIVPVGEWVVRSVCEQISRWRAEGLTPLPVAINLSARQFRQKNLDAVIASIVAETGTDPGLLEFELTESMLMADPEEAVRIMKSMKASGVRLSLDDFGTGYSSLAYLKKFPLDALKIDRAFVRDITTDADDATLAVAIISLAHTMDLKVVAEGVEAEAQLNFLAGHGCDEMQGYYFARPMEADKCAQALREGRRLQKPAPGTGKTAILLVDDDPEYLRTLERTLRHDGYEIQTAAGPQQALDTLAKRAYQVVVSDQTMPEMTGVEFLAIVQSLYPDAVRIVATVCDDGGTVTDAVNKAGIHKYLWKSWNAARLRSEVRDAYQRYGQPFARKLAA